LKRAAALALREMMKEPEPNDRARDMAAFIALSLEAITETVDITVSAWEKRDYWVKADRFRRDWAWAEHKSQAGRAAVLHNDWGELAHLMPEIASQLQSTKIPKRNTIGHAWNGAYEQLRNDLS